MHGAGTFSDYPPQIFLDHVPEGDEPEAEMGAHDWEDAGPQSKSVTLSPGERAAPLLCVLCALCVLALPTRMRFFLCEERLSQPVPESQASLQADGS